MYKHVQPAAGAVEDSSAVFSPMSMNT